MIQKLIISNFKIFREFTLELDPELNLLVGNNESGKTSIFEAINLALTRKINGRYLEEISPYLFNKNVVSEYLELLKQGKKLRPPSMFIELYFSSTPELEPLSGNTNSLREDAPGIRIEIGFNPDFNKEFEELLKEPLEIKVLPTEYYQVKWKSFADNALTTRTLKATASYINASTYRMQTGADYYFQNIIDAGLDAKDKVALSVAYRRLKEEFADEDAIQEINRGLQERRGEITEKELSIALDVSQKSSWEANIVPHLDDLPVLFSGGGEQSLLKIMLALHVDAELSNVVLIEEPENHLSFSWMNKLLNKIREKSQGKQIIVTTHSSFVINKMGLDKLVLVGRGVNLHLKDLASDTQAYFKKLSGYDTLRLILANKSILVEGPSDELLVQKAYLIQKGKLPIEDGIDVINVRGLSFKRFLDIAVALKLDVGVVTDNDGDFNKNVVERYKEYQLANIEIFSSSDNNLQTLEYHLVALNDLALLNKVFKTNYEDQVGLLTYMIKNKTEVALKLFESQEQIGLPEYIEDAIK